MDEWQSEWMENLFYGCAFLVVIETWTVEELSLKLESQPSVTRRHLVYWVSQGVLYEDPLDNFNVVEEEGKDVPQREGKTIN